MTCFRYNTTQKISSLRQVIVYENFLLYCFPTFSFEGKLRKYDISVKWKHMKTNESKIFSALFTNFCKTSILLFMQYVNYANIAWASTNRSKLKRLYRCQKDAARLICHKDQFTHASPLLNDTKAVNVFKLNIFRILCKCKQILNPHVFHNIFTHRRKTKYALGNENSIQ